MILEDYKEISARCSQCNFCQAVCPVFMAKGTENWLARNRLSLIRKVLMEKTMEPTPRFSEILDTCLLCTGCAQNCSSNVPVDEIIIAARRRMSERGGKISSVRKKLLSGLMKSSSAMNFMVKAGSVAQKFGFTPENLPSISSRSFQSRRSGILKPDGVSEERVVYYAGCGTNFFFPETGEALTDILLKLKTEVVIPDGTACCGIPLLSEGDVDGAAELFRKNIEILSALECDRIIMDCTSCIMMFIKKGSKLFSKEDPVMEKLMAVSSKIENAMTYIQRNRNIKKRESADAVSFTWHVPCHLNKSDRDYHAGEIVASITGAEYRALEDPELCCGAGGAYYMSDSGLSETIRERKIRDIQKSGARTVVTECPMCRYYIGEGNPDVEVIHPIDYISRSMS